MNVPVEEDYQQELEEAMDDSDGQEVDPQAVKKARALEIKCDRKTRVYEKRLIQERSEKTKKPPIQVKCDHNKGDRHKLNLRSRLLAKQNNTSNGECFFAATPPLEAFWMLLSTTVSVNNSMAPMFNDICRDFMHARTTDTYVELCEEDRTEPGDEHRCGKLTKSMYPWLAGGSDENTGVGVQARKSIFMCVLASAERHQSSCQQTRLRAIW